MISSFHPTVLVLTQKAGAMPRDIQALQSRFPELPLSFYKGFPIFQGEVAPRSSRCSCWNGSACETINGLIGCFAASPDPDARRDGDPQSL